MNCNNKICNYFKMMNNLVNISNFRNGLFRFPIDATEVFTACARCQIVDGAKGNIDMVFDLFKGFPQGDKLLGTKGRIAVHLCDDGMLCWFIWK